MSQLFNRVKQVLRRLKESVIQTCPPELYACEVCRELECDQKRWQNCEHRLQVAAEVRAAEQELVNLSQPESGQSSTTDGKPSPDDRVGESS